MNAYSVNVERRLKEGRNQPLDRGMLVALDDGEEELEPNIEAPESFPSETNPEILRFQEVNWLKAYLRTNPLATESIERGRRQCMSSCYQLNKGGGILNLSHATEGAWMWAMVNYNTIAAQVDEDCALDKLTNFFWDDVVPEIGLKLQKWRQWRWGLTQASYHASDRATFLNWTVQVPLEEVTRRAVDVEDVLQDVTRVIISSSKMYAYTEYGVERAHGWVHWNSLDGAYKYQSGRVLAGSQSYKLQRTAEWRGVYYWHFGAGVDSELAVVPRVYTDVRVDELALVDKVDVSGQRAVFRSSLVDTCFIPARVHFRNKNVPNGRYTTHGLQTLTVGESMCYLVESQTDENGNVYLYYDFPPETFVSYMINTRKELGYRPVVSRDLAVADACDRFIIIDAEGGYAKVEGEYKLLIPVMSVINVTNYKMGPPQVFYDGRNMDLLWTLPFVAQKFLRPFKSAFGTGYDSWKSVIKEYVQAGYRVYAKGPAFEVMSLAGRGIDCQTVPLVTVRDGAQSGLSGGGWTVWDVGGQRYDVLRKIYGESAYDIKSHSPQSEVQLFAIHMVLNSTYYRREVLWFQQYMVTQYFNRRQRNKPGWGASFSNAVLGSSYETHEQALLG